MTMNDKDRSRTKVRIARQLTIAVAFALVAAGGSLSTAMSARAELRLCNKTPAQVGIAIGYQSEQEWVSEGWWNLEAETCQVVVDGPLSSRYYYLFALDYEEGGAWGGSAFMCTHDKEFTIEGTGDCVARGYERRGFVEVDTGDKLSWTIRLTERPNLGIGGL